MVTVLVATFHRPSALRCALFSILQQTLLPQEILVIGDACEDETEEVVASFADPRIRFHNLPKRCGDQSAPTNYGIARARGEYIAFLSQDDLWFPDHLEKMVSKIEQTQADFVYAMQLDADPSPLGWQMRIPSLYLQSISPFLPPNLSVCLVRSGYAKKMPPIQPFSKLYTYPSVDWIEMGRKRGAVFSPLLEVTVLVFTTITRQDTYRKQESWEQEKALELLRQDPNCREKWCMEAFCNPRPTHLQGYSLFVLLRALAFRSIKKCLSFLRLSPIAVAVYVHSPKKWGFLPQKGGLQKKLYQKRGLVIKGKKT